MKITVHRGHPHAVGAFSTLGEVTTHQSPLTPDLVKNAEVLIVRSDTKINRALLAGSAVRIVGSVTSGTDHVDLEYLDSCGIKFVHAPGSNANAVAEYVMAALLRYASISGQRLKGKLIGIVGVGNIGGRVQRMAGALGLSVLANDPPREEREQSGEFVTLDALMECDIVTLHVPLVRTGASATYHLFDEKRIRSMKPASVLINTSRGEVVDSQGLASALASSHVSAGVLDVWENEPSIDQALLRAVLIGTPHIAGYSLDGKIAALRMVYEGICRLEGVAGKWPPMPESKPRVISIPGKMADQRDIVEFAVREAYDIMHDDAILRKGLDRTAVRWSQHFSELRAHYRERREFSHYKVILLPPQRSAEPVLRQLGFRCDAGETTSEVRSDNR